MAEEGNLGLVRVQDYHDLSKEDLQKRLDETRQSLSETVTEIKETVQHQVQAVKETLDWRENLKNSPDAGRAGASGLINTRARVQASFNGWRTLRRTGELRKRLEQSGMSSCRSCLTSRRL